jgi:hypothetical protein
MEHSKWLFSCAPFVSRHNGAVTALLTFAKKVLFAPSLMMGTENLRRRNSRCVCSQQQRKSDCKAALALTALA